MGTKPHKGSLLSKIEHLEPGERAYIETKQAGYGSDMRRISAQSRYPDSMKGRTYSCALYRALGPSVLDGVRLLIAVDRLT